MSKFITSKLKIIRKFGKIITLSNKIIKNRKKMPGEHGILNTEKINTLLLSDDYSERLFEKQKLRFFYNLSEKQLFLYYKKIKNKKGI
jgi:ribosomal protein S4